MGLHSILTDSTEKLELDTSSDEADTRSSLVCTGFLIFLNHNLLLTLDLINYGAMLGHSFSLYHRQAKCQPLS